MAEFSFVIPVYNAEASLRRCLDSVSQQTFDNYEVLMIDDGSTDKSPEICREYIKKNSRSWILIQQQNEGPSSARNSGLDHASGEYICFLDSDDCIDPDYLEKLHRITAAEHPEVIFFGYRKITDNRQKKECIPEKGNTDKIDSFLWLSEHGLFGYPWVKCFSSEAIGSCRFDKRLNLFEDEVFTCQVLKQCENISFMPEAVYSYYAGNESALTGRTHPDYCFKLNEVYKAWKHMLQDYTGRNAILEKKADSFTAMSRYYGFERPVKTADYFRSLKRTDYFQEKAGKDQFDRYVQSENVLMIALCRQMYRLKQKLYQLKKRRK